MTIIAPIEYQKPLTSIIRLLKDSNERVRIAKKIMDLMKMLSEPETTVTEINNNIAIDYNGLAYLVPIHSKDPNGMTLRERTSNTDFSGMQSSSNLKRRSISARNEKTSSMADRNKESEPSDDNRKRSKNDSSNEAAISETEHNSTPIQTPISNNNNEISSSTTDDNSASNDNLNWNQVLNHIKDGVCRFIDKELMAESFDLTPNISVQRFVEHCHIALAKSSKLYVDICYILYVEKKILLDNGVDSSDLEKQILQAGNINLKTLRGWWGRGQKLYRLEEALHTRHHLLFRCSIRWSQIYNMSEPDFKLLIRELHRWNHGNGKTLCFHNLLCLSHSRWLEGQVIDEAFQILCHDIPNCFDIMSLISVEHALQDDSLLASKNENSVIRINSDDDDSNNDGIKDVRPSVKTYHGVDLVQSNLIYMPCYIDTSHFFLVCVKNLKNHIEKGTTATIYVMDSKHQNASKEERVKKAIVNYLKRIIEAENLNFYETGLSFKFLKVPQQRDSMSCGIFVIYFFEQIVRKGVVSEGDLENFMENLSIPNVREERQKWHTKLLNYLNA